MRSSKKILGRNLGVVLNFNFLGENEGVVIMGSVWQSLLRVFCIICSCWVFQSNFFKTPFQSLKENLVYLLCSYVLLYFMVFFDFLIAGN